MFDGRSTAFGHGIDVSVQLSAQLGDPNWLHGPCRGPKTHVNGTWTPLTFLGASVSGTLKSAVFICVFGADKSKTFLPARVK